MTGLQLFWFIIVGVLFSGFFFLEGFDYGVGMSAITVAKDKREVEQAIGSIGPVWDLNEVWLLTAGLVMQDLIELKPVEQCLLHFLIGMPLYSQVSI